MLCLVSCYQTAFFTSSLGTRLCYAHINLHGHVPCSQLVVPYIDQEMNIRTFFVTQDREKSTDYVEAAAAQESIDSVEGAAAQESTDSVINFVHDPPPNPVHPYVYWCSFSVLSPCFEDDCQLRSDYVFF